jgi:hypothetical protein
MWKGQKKEIIFPIHGSFLFLVDNNWLCMLQKESLVIVYFILFYFKKTITNRNGNELQKKYLTITDVYKITL